MPASPRSGTRLPGGDICPAQEPPPHGGTSARSGRKYKCRIPPRAGASARSAMERRTHGHGTTPEHTGEEDATPPAPYPPFPHAGTCLPFCEKDIPGHVRFPTQRDTPPRRRHMPRAGAAPARRDVCPFRPKIQMSDSPARRSFCPFCHGKADAWAWHNTGTYR